MRWQLIGAFGLIILIALGTVALVARYTTEQEVQTFISHGGQTGLENLASSLEDYYAANGSWDGVDQTFTPGHGRGQGQRSGANAAWADHRLADEAGLVLISPDLEEVGTSLPDGTLARSISLVVANERVGYLIPEGGIPDLPDDFEKILIERVNRASFLAALISGGIAVILALILAAIILKPIHNLTTAVQKMASGDLNQRVHIRGKSELGMLGESFNHMAGSLQQAETHRTTMTADIAHELRNPLAIQRAHLEALQDGVFPLNQENLDLVIEQNQQLTRLVEDLRMLALADAGELSLNKRMIDLVGVCQETIARFEPQANGKQIQLLFDNNVEALFVIADKERLQQIHDNLMQNALRYTPEGGWIRLSLTRQGQEGIISIHNNGQQISDESLRHLFERFFREDKGRDRASGGTGLGLAIARELAEAHDGKLMGENHPAGGVVFRLVLPIY